eukprot:Filipodium_phascolosomae@DN2697_c0_g1_i3.p1
MIDTRPCSKPHKFSYCSSPGKRPQGVWLPKPKRGGKQLELAFNGACEQGTGGSVELAMAIIMLEIVEIAKNIGSCACVAEGPKVVKGVIVEMATNGYSEAQ